MSHALVFLGPRPTAQCRTEHQRSTRRPVQAQVVGLGAVEVGCRAAVVGKCLDAADGRRREIELAGRPDAIVGVDVPFEAQRADALAPRVKLWPEVSLAAAVFRQSLALAYWDGP